MTENEGTPPGIRVKFLEPPQDDIPGGPSAEDESNLFATGKLEEAAAENEHVRTEKIKDLLSRLIQVLIVFFFGLAVWIVFVWTFHLLMPSNFHYLTESQLTEIQKIMFTGIFSGLLAIIGNNLAVKYLGSNNHQ